MSSVLVTFALATMLFAGMLVCFQLGRRSRQAEKQPKHAVEPKSDAIEAAVFGLLGLLLAFTFFGASDRFDTRRALIVEEANAIGAAYLLVDLLPVEVQPDVRKDFLNYIDSRLEYYRRLSHENEAEEEFALSEKLQKQIWNRTVSGSMAPGAHPDAGKLLLPALNSMIDTASTRKIAMKMHPPKIIFMMLFVFAYVCSLFVGRGVARFKPDWLAMCIFAGVLAFAVYIILDIEYPRFGFIRVDSFDQVLVDVRAQMDDGK